MLRNADMTRLPLTSRERMRTDDWWDWMGGRRHVCGRLVVSALVSQIDQLAERCQCQYMRPQVKSGLSGRNAAEAINQLFEPITTTDVIDGRWREGVQLSLFTTAYSRLVHGRKSSLSGFKSSLSRFLDLTRFLKCT